MVEEVLCIHVILQSPEPLPIPVASATIFVLATVEIGCRGEDGGGRIKKIARDAFPCRD